LLAVSAFAALMLMSLGGALAREFDAVIGSIDWTTRQIILTDGKTYSVQRGINLAKFKAGDNVTLESEDERGKIIVTKMTKAGETVDRSKKRSARNRVF
jgi:Cu/Ag efflux protein CusF